VPGKIWQTPISEREQFLPEQWQTISAIQ